MRRTLLRSATRACARAPLSRGLATRTYQCRELEASGAVTPISAEPRTLVESFDMLPRDIRLLSTQSSQLHVRDSYFIFRFPPLTGCVRHDRVLLVADDSAPATATLERTIAEAHAASTGAPFEHTVLEIVLHEMTLYKQDRYGRLARLTRQALAEADGAAGNTWLLGSQRREAALYKLLSLRNALSALEVDVRRAHATLLALLGADEDMAQMYLTHAAQRGERRPTDEHLQVELLVESVAVDMEELEDRLAALQQAGPY